jgi:membrane-bound metal-dependent hydrolase YbcI (DUF457 family)
LEENKLPFTPFHFGPALFLGLLLSTAFDLPTFLIANVLPDVEPFTVVYFNVQGYPLHGFFHSYIGATILAVILALCMYLLRGFVGKIMKVFRLQQSSSFKKIVFTSFMGAYFHVFLDSFLYSEMTPFYPLPGNVFSAYGSYTIIYGFCGITALLGIVLYLYKISVQKVSEQQPFSGAAGEKV